MENVEADSIGCIKKLGLLTFVTHIFPEAAGEDFYTSVTCKQTCQWPESKLIGCKRQRYHYEDGGN